MKHIQGNIDNNNNNNNNNTIILLLTVILLMTFGLFINLDCYCLLLACAPKR